MTDEPEILCCQFCGRLTLSDADGAVHWLVDRHKAYEGVWVIRCPHHISEWAMRNTVSGRTNENREKAKRGRDMDLLPVTGLEPYPTHLRGGGP